MNQLSLMCVYYLYLYAILEWSVFRFPIQWFLALIKATSTPKKLPATMNSF